MAYATYAYRMPWGEVLRIEADLSEASAPIHYAGPDLEDGADWIMTPYCTASACHREDRMLRLVVEYLGPEWYRDPSSDLSIEEQLERAIRGAREIRGWRRVA